MNETQKTLRLLTPSFFNYANINRVFCGYNTVTYFSEKTIFTSCSRFLVYREVDVYPSNTKILSAHLSLQTYAVTHDEHVYVKRQKGVFTKTNDLPTIGKSETIVALGTQYDEEILVCFCFSLTVRLFVQEKVCNYMQIGNLMILILYKLIIVKLPDICFCSLMSMYLNKNKQN
jgi:hypothetical protein